MSSSGAVLALVIVGCLAAVGALAVLVVLLRRSGSSRQPLRHVPEPTSLTEAETARLQADADAYAAELKAKAEREAAEIVRKAEAAAATATESRREAESRGQGSQGRGAAAAC